MWFRRMAFTGTADTFSIAVEKGQRIFATCYTTNVRMANFEQDLADGLQHFVIPCDTANKSGILDFVVDDTMMLYFTPDSNNAAVLTIMVLQND